MTIVTDRAGAFQSKGVLPGLYTWHSLPGAERTVKILPIIVTVS